MLWKLHPGGEAGVVLANGSMSSNTSGEKQIRESMVRGDVVGVIVALPGQLFLNTQIPVCLWFLSNDRPSVVGIGEGRASSSMPARWGRWSVVWSEC